MKVKALALLVGGVLLVSVVVFRRSARDESQSIATPIELATNQIAVASNGVAVDEKIQELRKIVVEDYHSTNEDESITSLLVQQLIAERLRTNAAFLEWATNATRSSILRFMENGAVPVYGSTGIAARSLQIDQVTAQVPNGLQARGTFDPNPTNEGPLVFVVVGGVSPALQMVQNGYRVQSYQLDQESWQRAPRKIGRMDWSSAGAPLDEYQVDMLAQKAFRGMTGLELKSFDVGATTIRTPKILNTSAVHPEVKAVGNPNAKLFTPKDYVYPFATFKYGESNAARVSFSGELVQTSPGRGEFVNLLALVKKSGSLFDLGEKFLGQGTWERDLVNQVRSMNTDQRGAVYRRVFIH